MASFRKRGSSWQVQIRRSGHPPVTRTFKSKSNADAWSRQVEAEIERMPGAILADLTFAAARAEPPSTIFRSWRRTAGLSPP